MSPTSLWRPLLGVDNRIHNSANQVLRLSPAHSVVYTPKDGSLSKHETDFESFTTFQKESAHSNTRHVTLLTRCDLRIEPNFILFPAEREKSFSLRYYDICGSSDGVANSQSETSNLVPQSQGTHLHSTTFIVPQIVYPNIMFRSSGENFGDGPKKNYKSKPRNFGTSMDNMYLPHSQAKHLSMTERRLQSNTPVVQGQSQLPVHTPSTWYQELISPFHGEGLRTGHDQNPITPMDQIPHFPLQLLEIQRDDKRKVDDCMLGWRRSPSLDRSTPQEVSKSYNSPQDFMRGASNLSQSLTALTGTSYISSSEARSDDSSSPNSLHRKLSYSNTCSFTSPPLGYSATIGLFSPTATSDVESMDSVLQPPIEKHEY